MILEWLNGREAAEHRRRSGRPICAADAICRHAGFNSKRRPPDRWRLLLRRADSEVRPLKLNFYKKAKFANSFKWRLIENGIARETADHVTQSLVLHLSQSQDPASNRTLPEAPAKRQTRPRPSNTSAAAINSLSKAPMLRLLSLMRRQSNLTPRMPWRSTIWGRRCHIWAATKRQSSAIANQWRQSRITQIRTAILETCCG